MTGGFKLKFSFRLPGFFRRRRSSSKADVIRGESKLDNSGGGDSFLDYYRTYWASSQTLATDLEELPGISDTAKILRFLLSEDGAGGGLLFCDDIIRSAEDYEEDVMGLEISTDKKKSRLKQHQKGSESKRGQQRRATEDRLIPAGGQLARSDLARGQGPSMQEDWTATAGGQQKRPDLGGRGQGSRMPEDWTAHAGGQLKGPDLGGRGQEPRMPEDWTATAGGQQKRPDLVERGQGSRMQEDWTAPAGGQLKRPDLGGRGQGLRMQEDWTATAGGQLKRPDVNGGQWTRLQEDWTAPAGGQQKRPDLNGGQWARLQEGWSAAVGGQASERERSYSCEQRRDVAQNRFLSEESRAWYSTPSKLELRASEWL
jgi:hypothetical protein